MSGAKNKDFVIEPLTRLCRLMAGILVQNIEEVVGTKTYSFINFSKNLSGTFNLF